MQPEQLERIFNWVIHNFFQILVIFSIFIQITPVKWNPVSSFFKWISKLLTGDLTKKMDDISDQVGALQDDVDTNEKDRIRWEILDFASSCRNNEMHSHDEFKHIADLHDKYKKLLEKTNDKNGVFDTEYEWIQSIYKKRLDKNDFSK